jgi:hypothetical protein
MEEGSEKNDSELEEILVNKQQICEAIAIMRRALKGGATTVT